MEPWVIDGEGPVEQAAGISPTPAEPSSESGPSLSPQIHYPVCWGRTFVCAVFSFWNAFHMLSLFPTPILKAILPRNLVETSSHSGNLCRL